MEKKIERLKRKIADLRWKLEQLALDRIEVSADQGEHMYRTPEFERHELRLFALDVREEALAARLTALELKLAELTVQAEVERLMKLQPCPSVAEINAHRERLKQVLARHKESATQQYEAAIDGDIATERINAGMSQAPLPEHRRKQGPDRGYDGPEQGYHGPRLGYR